MAPKRSLLFPCPDLVGSAQLYGPDTRYAAFQTANVFSPADMEVSNLALRDLSQPYRVISSSRVKTFMEADFGSTKTLDGLAVALATWSPSATARVMVSDTGGTGNARPFVDMLAPDALVSSVNYTSADVANADDDPDNPDTLPLGSATSNASDTEALFSFPTPDRSLLSGAGLQIVRVQAGTSGGEADRTMEVLLFEGGVEVASLGTFTVSNSVDNGGTVGEFSFNASSLALATGANVQIKCVGTSSASIVPVVGAIAWYAALDSLVHDSGDLAVLPSLVDGENFGLDRNLYYAFATPAAGRYLRIEVDDPSSSYLDFSRLIAGREVMQGARLSSDVAHEGYEATVDYSLSTMEVMRSGQPVFDVAPGKPILRTINFRALEEEEADALLDHVGMRVGVGGDICWIPDTNTAVERRVYRAMYATVERVTKHTVPARGGRAFNVRIQLRGLTAR